MLYEFEKNKLKAYIGNDLYNLLHQYKCFVAGGTITSLFCNREINDVDIYFRSKEDIKRFILNEVKDTDMWIVAKTKKALLLKNNGKLIQLICFDVFDTPEKIFNTFDFDVCMGCFDFDKEEFILHQDFLKHNSQRILMFNEKTAYPIVSALRVDKYKKKGYSISKTEYLRIMLTCMNLHIDNYDDLKEQLGGMYGVNYDDVIKPLEDEEFDLATVISKMSEIIYHPDYFKPYAESVVNINNWSVFVNALLGVKVDVYEFKGRFYIHEGREFDDVTTEVDGLNCEIHPISEIFKEGFSIYKNVVQTDNGFISHYDKSFEYKIGELAVGRGECCYGDKRKYGIFGCIDLAGTQFTSGYSSRKSVVLELKVKDVDELIDIDSAIEVKSATPVRVVPEDEVKKAYENSKYGDCSDAWLDDL